LWIPTGYLRIWCDGFKCRKYLLDLVSGLKLQELEQFMFSNLADLMDECSDVCTEGKPPSVSIVEGVIYSGCDLCLIRAALDKVNPPSISIVFRDGRYGEFVLLDQYVLELTEESAQLIPVQEFKERLDDLETFGLISEEDRRVLEEWFRKASK